MRHLSQDKRASIVDIAYRLFVAHGYGGLTMDALATAVGGSKATLYRYFSGKEDVFKAVIMASGEALFRDLETLTPTGRDLEASLEALGMAYLTLILDARVVEVGRMVISEAMRFPELGDIFFRQGPERTAGKIAAALSDLAARHRCPGLATPAAARHFMAMCQADLYDLRLWGVARHTGRGAMESAVRAACARFLDGYRLEEERSAAHP